MLQPRLPLWKYSLAAFPLALFPSVILLGAVVLIAGPVGIDTTAIQAPERTVSTAEFVGVVVLAPVVETVLLALLLRCLLAASTRPLFVALSAALLWGAAHGLLGALWFFGTVWSFFVFACGYLAWRRDSFHKAFAAAAVPHALVNLTAFALLAFLDAA